MKTTLLTILLLITFVFGAQAQKETACSISAYINDRDPNGFNVRNGAGTSFKVIGAIPYNSDGTMVDIIASNGKWMKISGAHDAEGDRTFSKIGWVYASYLGVTITGKRPGTVKAYSTPSKSGKVVANLPIDAEYTLESCSGSWMQISISKGSGPVSGWIPAENQCGNPWTSCS